MKKVFILTLILAVVGNAVLSHGESTVKEAYAKKEALLNSI